MPGDPLTAAILMGGGGNAAMLDPALMGVMPEIQLGQGMEQGSLSTAPASPAQALARVFQAFAGQSMMKGGLSDLGRLYTGQAQRMAPLFEGTPLGKALASGDPVQQMMAMQQVPKVLAANSLGYTLNSPGAVRAQGNVNVNENPNPQSNVGKIVSDQEKAAARGNPAGVAAIGSGLTKETSTPEGVQFPPTNAIPQSARGVGAQPMAAVPPPMQPSPVEMANARDKLAAGLRQEQESGVTQGHATGLVENDMPGRIAGATATIEGAKQAMQDFVEKDTPAYNSARNLENRFAVIDHDINALGPSWMGAGADTKAEAAKAWNSALDTAGVQGFHIDPNKIATWEEFNKETTRAGMELIKSNFGGSREAASIIQMGRTAVPSVQGTYLGQKYVLATIRAANQMQMDLYDYKRQLAGGGKSLVGAETDFYKAQPPEQYAMGAITSQIPPAAVAHLRQHPNLAAQFDQQFGNGTAKFLLGQK